MPPVENKRAVMKMLDAFNTGNTDIVDQLVDAQHKDLTPFPATKPNRDGLKMQIRMLREAFPDVKFTIEQISAEKETVAYRWKMVGTHQGNLFGYKATAKKITHFGNDFVLFKRGKMVEHHSADNLRDLLDKLGLPPKFKPNP
jgi:predicted ester cyclase